MLAGVAIGFLSPAAAEIMRPLVVPISVVMVVVSMLRIEPARLVATFRRPVFVALAGFFVLLALPLVTFLVARLLGAPGWLTTGLTYAAAAPPLSSTRLIDVATPRPRELFLAVTTQPAHRQSSPHQGHQSECRRLWNCCNDGQIIAHVVAH